MSQVEYNFKVLKSYLIIVKQPNLNKKNEWFDYLFPKNENNQEENKKKPYLTLLYTMDQVFIKTLKTHCS